MFLRRLLVVVVASTFCISSTFAQGFAAGAQMSAGFQPWGSGAWGGAQGCVADNGGSGARIPRELRNMRDDIDEKEKLKKRKEKEAKDLKAELKKLNDSANVMKKGVESVFKTEDNILEGIKQHIGFSANPLRAENVGIDKVCKDRNLVEGDPTISLSLPGAWGISYCANQHVTGSGTVTADKELPAQQAPVEDWQGSWDNYSESSKTRPGTISNEICNDSQFIKSDYQLNNGRQKTREQNNMIEACKSGVVELAELLQEIRDKEEKLRIANSDVKTLKDEITADRKALKDRRKEIDEEREDGNYEEDEDERTQADYCPTGNCRGGQRVSSTDRIISLVSSLGIAAGSYFGLRAQGRAYERAAQYASDKNAELGWPTSTQPWGLSPYVATGIALPFAMAGIYGAGFGGGIGGNGCGGFGGIGGMGGWPGGGQFGGGAFGYPQGWGPNGGGGIMNGGCGPWGCTGFPGGFPGGGYGVPFANMGGGFQGGFPGGFQGGFPGGFQGGFPGGFQGGFQGGFPGGFQGGFQATFNSYPMPQVGFPGGFQGGFQGFPMAGGPITGVYSTNTGIPFVPMGGNYAGQYTGTGGFPGGFQGGGVGFPGGFQGGGVGFPGGFAGGGLYAPTYNAYPFPAGGGGFQGGFQGGGFPGGFQGGFPGGFQGGFPGGFQGGFPGGFQGGFNPLVQDYGARLQLIGRLSTQSSQIQYQIQSILSGVGSASGFGYGGFGGAGFPTGTILPFPNNTIDPNLNTTTTGSGVTPARGRFGN
jgi:hypothetical protein